MPLLAVPAPDHVFVCLSLQTLVLLEGRLDQLAARLQVALCVAVQGCAAALSPPCPHPLLWISFSPVR